jgi:hypothetical protein
LSGTDFDVDLGTDFDADLGADIAERGWFSITPGPTSEPGARSP